MTNLSGGRNEAVMGTTPSETRIGQTQSRQGPRVESSIETQRIQTNPEWARQSVARWNAGIGFRDNWRLIAWRLSRHCNYLATVWPNVVRATDLTLSFTNDSPAAHTIGEPGPSPANADGSEGYPDPTLDNQKYASGRCRMARSGAGLPFACREKSVNSTSATAEDETANAERMLPRGSAGAAAG